MAKRKITDGIGDEPSTFMEYNQYANMKCSYDYFCFGNKKMFFQMYCIHFPSYTCLQLPSFVTKM